MHLPATPILETFQRVAYRDYARAQLTWKPLGSLPFMLGKYSSAD